MTILFYPEAINQPFYFDITSQQIPCLHSSLNLPDFPTSFIQSIDTRHGTMVHILLGELTGSLS